MIDLTGGRRSLRRWLQKGIGTAIGLAGCGLGVMAIPAYGAEEIIITYGFFERTIAIEDLEAFAAGEGLSQQLAQYAATFGLTEAELTAIRAVLTQRADVDEVDVAQFFYTTQGKTLLRFLGEVVQTPTRRSGFHAIRGSLILAAADDEAGLTLLNFLKRYPTPAIRIDVAKGLEIAGAITEVLGESERAIALVQTLAAIDAAQPLAGQEAARQLIYQPSEFDVRTQPLNLPFRGVEATLFLPQPKSIAQRLPTEIPVIVISHGLGDERASYNYLANYLAGRGFAVATLDHPGSNSQQIAQLLAGLSPNIVNDREFLNRPADVSELLNELQRLAIGDRELRWRLNTQNVGVIGHSFGGYTALALAGATYDRTALDAACAPRPIYFNPSLLLQCQATVVAAEVPPLQDDRVKAILVVNPVGSGIFGPTGFGQVQVPVMVMAATADTVSPALPEQIEPFTWLQAEHRYLALMSGTTHFSVINTSGAPSIPVPATLLGRDPATSQTYLQVLSLAFFGRHLQQDVRYEAALTARFAQESVARSPLEPLSLLQGLSPEVLERAIDGEALVTETAE
ncbi:MAG TPA: alpha/beta fold hydrolase [Candidatus Obscuribacterales bacterium]